MHITDATGFILEFDRPFKRLVSLFPSQTFLLWHLGLDDEVKGITRFCKYPPHWRKQKRVVGGTKDAKIDRILALEPDLVLANKEENTKETVEELRRHVPVYTSEVVTWDDNLRFIRQTGMLTGREAEAGKLIRQVETKRRAWQERQGNQRRQALYFIWRKPWMTAGTGTFIHTMLHMAGFENLTRAPRYPMWDESELAEMHPEVVLLSSEPFPFKEKHADELRAFFPEAEFLLVEGEPFTWFGAYPLQAFDYFANLQQK